jgi:hypothetical protein
MNFWKFGTLLQEEKRREKKREIQIVRMERESLAAVDGEEVD